MLVRGLSIVLLVVSVAAAQPRPQAALVRGVLLDRDETAGGQLSVRTEHNQILRYQFDRKTYVERENQLIDVPRLKPGEKIEVVSDVVPGSYLRYARTIHVMQDAPPPRPLSSGRPRPYRPNEEPRLPASSVAYAGVVSRLNQERVVLRTRQGDRTLLLRRDTRYLENGEIVEAATLQPNTRVFIRAGKDAYDQLEAYQIIWGNILNPR